MPYLFACICKYGGANTLSKTPPVLAEWRGRRKKKHFVARQNRRGFLRTPHHRSSHTTPTPAPTPPHPNTPTPQPLRKKNFKTHSLALTIVKRNNFNLLLHETFGGGFSVLAHTAVLKLRRLARKVARGSVDRTAYSPKYSLSFMSHHAERISLSVVRGVNRAIRSHLATLSARLARA